MAMGVTAAALKDLYKIGACNQLATRPVAHFCFQQCWEKNLKHELVYLKKVLTLELFSIPRAFPKCLSVALGIILNSRTTTSGFAIELSFVTSK